MWTEPILHVDMDSFFVEVERLRDPGLRDRPVAVGGTGARGVIASASYEARGHGVRSAQPTSVARRMCPDLLVVAPDHGAYREASVAVFEVFRSYTPLVEGLSLDEAFLDVSGLRLHHPAPIDVARAIRSSLRSLLGLPASVGVASVKFIAKLASQAAKPDGVCVVERESQLAFLHELPVSAMWGVGPATQAGLERLGIESIGDLSDVPESVLVASLGPTSGRHLLDLANGLDPRRVEPDSEAKSVSVEETYAQDLVGKDVIQTALLAHSERLSWRLRRAGLRGTTLSLKVRFHDFKTVTRSETLSAPVDSGREIYAATRPLLVAADIEEPVRLLGLAMTGLVPDVAPEQQSLEGRGPWDRVDMALREVRAKFGETAVTPARLAPGAEPPDTTREP